MWTRRTGAGAPPPPGAAAPSPPYEAALRAGIERALRRGLATSVEHSAVEAAAFRDGALAALARAVRGESE